MKTITDICRTIAIFVGVLVAAFCLFTVFANLSF